jgi:alpha-L-rhamnosidase
MSSAAKVLGHSDAARTYDQWRESTAAAIANRFFERESGSFGSQGGNVLALAFGILPEEEERIFEALVEDILKRNTHLNVGVMGVRYLFEELTKRGRGDLALALMHKDSYPSFGNLIQRGATTLWECWGEASHDETHGPRSLNHPFMGGYDNWFYNTLAGIRPDSEVPGFRHFFLTPHPITGLEWVCAKYNSPHGQIVSDWRFTNNVLEWKVTIPQNSNATASLPFSGSVKKLGPGSHELIDRSG